MTDTIPEFEPETSVMPGGDVDHYTTADRHNDGIHDQNMKEGIYLCLIVPRGNMSTDSLQLEIFWQFRTKGQQLKL